MFGLTLAIAWAIAPAMFAQGVIVMADIKDQNVRFKSSDPNGPSPYMLTEVGPGRVGDLTPNSGGDTLSVFIVPFDLSDINGKITSADLKVNLERVSHLNHDADPIVQTGPLPFNIDVYGLGYSATPGELPPAPDGAQVGSDVDSVFFFAGADDDPNFAKVGDNLIAADNAAVGEHVLESTPELVKFLNDRNADVVWLRLSFDGPSTPGIVEVYNIADVGRDEFDEPSSDGPSLTITLDGNAPS